MSKVTKPSYKCCVVPLCTNTTVKTPEKIFFSVPKDPLKRKRWYNAMKRDNLKGKKMSYKSCMHCCEDHFSLEYDMENYYEFQLTKNVKKLKLKPEVIPHQFLCQQQKKAVMERKYIAKKKRHEVIQQCMSEMEVSSRIINENDVLDEEEMIIVQEIEEHFPKEKGIQVSLKPSHRSKYVNAAVLMITTATSPIKTPQANVSVMTSPEKMDIIHESDYSSSDYEPEPGAETDNYSSDEEIQNIKFKEHMLQGTYMCISRFPKLYIGLPEESVFVIKILVNVSRIPLRDVYIILKKMQLNDSFDLLAIDFGMSKSNVSRIFAKSLPLIAGLMENLIIWPSSEEVRAHLPIPFRARYAQVVSIIDCLEIQIEKPTNPVHQSLTWSSYKKGNTLKYLISCTPDGLVNFISCGYGGRASDTAIFEDCAYMRNLRPGDDVMADRGFKHVSSLLKLKGCNLIRPPSVEDSVPISRIEVKQAKQIAALRIHVERVIGRLREFKMLLPHCCLDKNLVILTDCIIKIACGLINMQSQILKC